MVGSNSAVSDCFVDHLRLQCMIAIPIKNLPTERLKEYGWIQDTLNMIFLDAFLVATYFTLTSGASLMVGQEGNNNTYFKSWTLLSIIQVPLRLLEPKQSCQTLALDQIKVILGIISTCAALTLELQLMIESCLLESQWISYLFISSLDYSERLLWLRNEPCSCWKGLQTELPLADTLVVLSVCKYFAGTRICTDPSVAHRWWVTSEVFTAKAAEPWEGRCDLWVSSY